MNKWLGFATLAAFVGAAATACSTSTSDKYPTYASMCDDVATQECQVAAACVLSADACKTARTKVCLDAANVAISGGRTYTAGRAQDCVDKSKDTFSKTPITPTDLAAQADTCARVYAGSKQKGDTCQSDYECSGSLVCDKQHCGDKVQKSKGDGCANPGETCETGTYCAQSGGVRICTPKIALGAQCDPVNAPCIETARCSAATGGTCVARVDIGGTCDAKRETDPNADCAAAAPLCDTTINECVDGLRFAPKAPDCSLMGGAGTDAGSPADSAPPVDSAPPTDSATGG